MQYIKKARSMILLVAMLFATLTFAHNHLKPAMQALNNSDYASAVALFVTAADNGDAEAQYQQGLLFTKGQGVDANEERAIEYMQMAASQEHEKAIDWLTERDIEPEGNPEDDC